MIRPRIRGTYIECFLGGGANFFNLEPSKAVLSDINSELINAYNVVKYNPIALIKKLKSIKVNKFTYYQIRSENPNSDFERAVRFIYLNRTCYGGLYRINRNGEFNVPYGGGSRNPNVLWEKNILLNASEILNKSDISLISGDFSDTLINTAPGDVVYCDPTYATVKRDNFDRYNGQIFKWSDQIRLSKICNDIFHNGVLVIISNAYSKAIESLYPDGLFIRLERNKSIGNKMKQSKTGFEYLIILDPEQDLNYWQNIGDISQTHITHICPKKSRE